MMAGKDRPHILWPSGCFIHSNIYQGTNISCGGMETNEGQSFPAGLESLVGETDVNT